MSNPLLIPCEVGKVSDGYHTFEELYQHRGVLFLKLLHCHPEQGWVSKLHHDGTSYPGFFIAGYLTPEGMVTYHLTDDLWQIALCTGCAVRKTAPEWDGHTAEDVLGRIVRTILGVRKDTDSESV